MYIHSKKTNVHSLKSNAFLCSEIDGISTKLLYIFYFFLFPPPFPLSTLSTHPVIHRMHLFFNLLHLAGSHMSPNLVHGALPLPDLASLPSLDTLDTVHSPRHAVVAFPSASASPKPDLLRPDSCSDLTPRRHRSVPPRGMASLRSNRALARLHVEQWCWLSSMSRNDARLSLWPLPTSGGI